MCWHGNEMFAGVLIVILVLMLGIALMFGLPIYGVWKEGKKGEAELRRAEQNKQIRIEEARAQMESSKLLASAEIERAKGVAEANKIIGESLENSEAYLRYLWVQALSEGSGNRQVIYIPTEGQLPLLEASRLLQ